MKGRWTAGRACEISYTNNKTLVWLNGSDQIGATARNPDRMWLSRRGREEPRR